MVQIQKEELVAHIIELAKGVTPGPWYAEARPRKHRMEIHTDSQETRLGYAGWKGFIEVNGSEEQPEEGMQAAISNAAYLIATQPQKLLPLLQELLQYRATPPATEAAPAAGEVDPDTVEPNPLAPEDGGPFLSDDWENDELSEIQAFANAAAEGRKTTHQVVDAYTLHVPRLLRWVAALTTPAPPAAAEEGGAWVAVADRLPQIDGPVLVCTLGVGANGGAVYSAWLYGEWWYTDDDTEEEVKHPAKFQEEGRTIHPTHWMPLPAPPAPTCPNNCTSCKKEPVVAQGLVVLPGEKGDGDE